MRRMRTTAHPVPLLPPRHHLPSPPLTNPPPYHHRPQFPPPLAFTLQNLQKFARCCRRQTEAWTSSGQRGFVRWNFKRLSTWLSRPLAVIKMASTRFSTGRVERGLPPAGRQKRPQNGIGSQKFSRWDMCAQWTMVRIRRLSRGYIMSDWGSVFRRTAFRASSSCSSQFEKGLKILRVLKMGSMGVCGLWLVAEPSQNKGRNARR